MLADPPCQELHLLRLRAATVFREVRQVRRSRDVSFLEDAHLNARKSESLTAIIKHLLAGHSGLPCPAGSRPIVSAAQPHPANLSDFLAQYYSADFFCTPSAPAVLLRCLRAVNRAMSRAATHVAGNFSSHLAARAFRQGSDGKPEASWVDIS